MDKFNTFKLFIEENKRKIIIICIFIFVLFLSTILFLNIDRKVTAKTETKIFENLNESNKEIEEAIEEDLKETYFVDIKGEVNLPGVYSVDEGNRIVDAINKAGGLTENADTTLLNLSIKVSDQMVIVVYSKEQIQKLNETKEVIKNSNKICKEEVVNEACIVNNKETTILPDLTNQNEVKEKVENFESNNSATPSNQKVNINTSTHSELVTIPKIGDSKANLIIEYRDANNGFKTIDEIKNIKGIGESIFETIKEYITVE